MSAHDGPFPVAMRVPLEDIDAAVCARLGPARVTGNAQPAAFNRQVAMYLAKYVGGWSTTKIGKFYNGRDHSTVCYAIRRIESMRDDSAELDALLTIMCRELRDQKARTADEADLSGAAKALSVRTNDQFLDSLVDRFVDRLIARLGKEPVALSGEPGL